MCVTISLSAPTNPTHKIISFKNWHNVSVAFSKHILHQNDTSHMLIWIVIDETTRCNEKSQWLFWGVANRLEEKYYVRRTIRITFFLHFISESFHLFFQITIHRKYILPLSFNEPRIKKGYIYICVQGSFTLSWILPNEARGCTI